MVSVILYQSAEKRRGVSMRSIKVKMILLSLGTMLFLSAILGVITYRASYRALEHESTLALKMLSEEGAEQLSLLLQLQLKGLEGLASRERVRSMDWRRQQDALQPELKNLGYLALAVVDENGVARYVDGYTLPLGDRPYIQRALAGESRVSEVIISRATGEAVVMLATPIDTFDGTPAALIARMDGSLLNQLTEGIRFGDRGYAYLMNAEGVFIAYHLNPDLVFQQTKASDLVLEMPHLEGFSQFIEQALLEKEGIGHYQVNESTIHMGYSPVKGTGWTLFVGASADELFTGMRSFQEQFYQTIVVVFFLGILASLLMAIHFTNPIIELERLFTRAASGDLTVKANLKSRDEIGKAGHSFNLMMDQIRNLTYYDPVTDLPNQRVFFSDLRKAPTTFDEKNNQQAMLLFAPDRFQRINERYGYQEGNQVFRMIARRLEIYAGDHCRIYRGQSDEFILFCEKYQTLQQAKETALLLLQKVQEPYDLQDEKVSLTFSTGMVLYPLHGTGAEELLKNVSFAKNQAKEKGPGHFQMFDVSIQHQVLESRQIETEMIAALENKNFFLQYQPMVNLKTGKVVAVEALLRWQHEEKGLIPPDTFIPIAERSGFINQIGRWVLLEACQQLKEWQSMGFDEVVMAVNISAKQFESPEFMPYVRHTLIQTGVNPSQLELELTESAVIQQVTESIERLEKLRQMGLRISIDDFGTGFSSLSYIVRLPIDTLKIDRSFINHLEHSRQAQAIVSTIITMGHSLNLTLVAEGIETKEQLAIIQREACQLGQGYYFSQPVSDGHIERILRQGTFKPKLP